MKTIVFIIVFLVQAILIWAQDTPPNPVEKAGYRLIFHDEFDGTVLDTTKWVPEYLPSWPKERKISSPAYEMENGIIRLIVAKKSPNEFSKDFMISGFMSASRTGLHRYDPKLKARPVETKVTQLNQYGYYELRAKMQTGGGVHCAWWLIGLEDDPDQSCEIDIFEILGTDVNKVWATVHSWKDSTIKYHTESPYFANKKLAEEFHIYGFDWTEDSVKVYMDGIKIMEHKAAIRYPLVQILSFYDNRKAKDGWTGTYDPSVPYPKSFDIDYLRMYKKIPEGYKAVKETELQIVSVAPAELNIVAGSAALRNIDGHLTRELLCTPSYVNVHYNDGTVTQQYVKWKPITDTLLQRINNPGVVIVDGTIEGLPDALLKGQKASLIIRTEKAGDRP